MKPMMSVRKGFIFNLLLLLFISAIIFKYLESNVAINIFIYHKRISQNHPLSNHPLTKAFIREAYKKYANYQETYINFDQYLENFKVNIYHYYHVSNFAYFYLEDKPDIIKSILREGNRWEPKLADLMTKYVRKGSNVIDVGAHIGTHTILLAKLLDGKGTVWAFEPQTKIFVELNANLFANHAKNVKTLRYAVGDKKGAIEMNPTEIGNEGGTSIGHGGDKADLVTLDSFNIKNVSLIKIDVEGYEDQVIDGATQTIKRSKPIIIFEIMGGTDLNNASTDVLEKIMNTIHKIKILGYQVNHLSNNDYLALPRN